MKNMSNFTNIIQYFQQKRYDLLEERKDLDSKISEKQIEMENHINLLDQPHTYDTDSIQNLEHDLFSLISSLENIDSEISQIDSFISILNSSVQSSNDFNEFNDYNYVSKDYGKNVILLQEEDRRRISRELHDTSLQNLTYLVHKLELCDLLMDKDVQQSRNEIKNVVVSIKSTINEIRGIIYDLRPMSFDDLGFRDSVLYMLERMNANKKLFLNVSIDDVSCEKFLLINFYRIIQEAFINILKHSNASTATIQLIDYEDKYSLHIADDGDGFSYEQVQTQNYTHFGIILMKERVSLMGGSIHIDSKIGEGTFVDIYVNKEVVS